MRLLGRGRAAIASGVTAAALLVAAVPAPALGAPAPEFPAGYEGYHTYDEALANINAVIAARPKIVAKRAIGQSHEGRTIWAVKISDNVGRDENEPEVLFESLSHAREHLTVEQALRIIHLLADNYRAKASAIETDLQRRVSAIVKSREIWVIPMLNPDGGEHDLGDGTTFEGWRKNRQPTPDSTSIGTDLNRNWGFRWGCCGGSSGKPGALTYRGPRAWSTPEVSALRDFVLSRRINGRQQIRAAISWHSFNEEIMWPYGYTKADLPVTMTADDLDAFRTIGRGMASRNGYRPQQLSDLYIIDGGSTDWLYGDQRIFAFTIEMYPTGDVSVPAGFYPRDHVIERETTRNDGAVLYFLEHAACPYAEAGLSTRCGPLDDDFETGRGWTFNPGGTDTATRGAFQRAVPARTADGAGAKQLQYGFSGQAALVTGPKAGSSVAANDLDGGVTSAISPTARLGASGSRGWRLQFRYAFGHNAAATADDYLRVLVDGTEVFIDRATGANRNAEWQLVQVGLDAFAGQQVRVRIEAADGAGDSLVEVALDDVRIFRAP
jgi:hypothetical protein